MGMSQEPATAATGKVAMGRSDFTKKNWQPKLPVLLRSGQAYLQEPGRYFVGIGVAAPGPHLKPPTVVFGAYTVMAAPRASVGVS